MIVVPIFTNGLPGPTHIPLSAGIGGLPHDSVAYCEEITTIHHDFVSHGPLGPPITEEPIAKVIRAIRRAIGEAVPEP